MRKIVQLAVFGCMVALGASQANAETFNFGNITGNDVNDAASGEAQLSVVVTDAGGGQVLFTFFNTGSEAMIITDVYFEDGTLLGIAELMTLTTAEMPV